MSVRFHVSIDPPTPGVFIEHVFDINGEQAIPVGETDENGYIGYSVTYYDIPQFARIQEGQDYTGQSNTVTPVEGETYDLTILVCPYKRWIDGAPRPILCYIWRMLKKL